MGTPYKGVDAGTQIRTDFDVLRPNDHAFWRKAEQRELLRTTIGRQRYVVKFHSLTVMGAVLMFLGAIPFAWKQYKDATLVTDFDRLKKEWYEPKLRDEHNSDIPKWARNPYKLNEYNFRMMFRKF